MRINYIEVIAESVEELSRYEQAYRGDRQVSPRLRLLCLLKSGQAHSLRKAAPLLGYSDTQLERWWQLYRDGGLSAVLETGQWGGHRKERPSPEALAAVKEKAESGGLPTLEAARQYLAQTWAVVYESVSGVSELFRRHQIKKKTGRPRHRKADPAAQAAFRQTSEIGCPTPNRCGPLTRGASG